MKSRSRTLTEDEQGPVCLGGVRLDLLDRADFSRLLVDRRRGDGRPPMWVCYADTELMYRIRRREVEPDVESIDLLRLPAGRAARGRLAKLGSWSSDIADESDLPTTLRSAARAGHSIGILTRSELSARQWLGNFALGKAEGIVSQTWIWNDTSDPRKDPWTEIKTAHIDILLVDLGQPVQDAWIRMHALSVGSLIYIGRADGGRRQSGPLGRPAELLRRAIIEITGRHQLATASHVIPTELTIPKVSRSSRAGRFVASGTHAEICALAVTYRSGSHVDSFIDSLRSQARQNRIRLVVVDNHSDDDTMERLRKHDDVISIDSGANLGYAGALNLARQEARPCESIVVLNPDLVLGEDALALLLSRLRERGGGVVFPKILDDCGALQHSLRREPTWLRALGDALFGSAWPTRPGWLSELVLNPAEYEQPNKIDWATGATMLMDIETDAAVGAWDERFFLYSEEVDYCRRVRNAGRSVRYEPDAIAWHHGGGSSSNPALVALLAVNRVRYFEKWHGRLAALSYRIPVALGELRRSSAPAHRLSVAYLLGLRHWDTLPKAERPAP